MVGHGLEFEVVPGGVLEEHGVLFPWLTYEPKVGLNDELDPVRTQSIGEILELLDGFQGQSRVRDGNFVSVDRIEIIDAPIVVSRPVADDLVSIQRIVLPLFGGPSLFAPQDRPVKLLGFLQRMDGKGVVEGIAGGGDATGLVLRIATAGSGIAGSNDGS